MQYKTFTYRDNRHGQKSMQKDLNKFAKDGWRLVAQGERDGRYGVAKTAVLGAMFLPMALAGRKKGKLTMTMEKET